MLRSLSFLTLALVALSACDSGDGDGPTAADVAGIYDLAEIGFVPDAPTLQRVNVLDTLVTADSFVELFDSGQATLRIRRKGGTTRLVPGTFEIRNRQLRLRFDGGNEAELSRLLLPEVLTFDRDGSTLSLSEALTLDLNTYDAKRYPGTTFRAVEGTLTVRLTPRTDS